MADFDNGLPPAGTDITENSVGSVLIDTSEVRENDISGISSVMLETKEIEGGTHYTISVVTIDKEGASLRNRGMFL